MVNRTQDTGGKTAGATSWFVLRPVFRLKDHI
jgi:hypothetical protein